MKKKKKPDRTTADDEDYFGIGSIDFPEPEPEPAPVVPAKMPWFTNNNWPDEAPLLVAEDLKTRDLMGWVHRVFVCDADNAWFSDVPWRVDQALYRIIKKRVGRNNIAIAEYKSPLASRSKMASAWNRAMRDLGYAVPRRMLKSKNLK
jgi:hypothetical protein